MKLRTISISRTAIEIGLDLIAHSLIKSYSLTLSEAQAELAPLTWYINSGRASCDFLRMVLTAKPFMIARKLHQGGSYSEAMDRIKNYIGYEAEA